jgi:hypothetical protein
LKRFAQALCYGILFGELGSDALRTGILFERSPVAMSDG